MPYFFFFFELGFRVPACIATRLSYTVQNTNLRILVRKLKEEKGRQKGWDKEEGKKRRRSAAGAGIIQGGSGRGGRKLCLM
jgi:hypothetical protein